MLLRAGVLAARETNLQSPPGKPCQPIRMIASRDGIVSATRRLGRICWFHSFLDFPGGDFPAGFPGGDFPGGAFGTIKLVQCLMLKPLYLSLLNDPRASQPWVVFDATCWAGQLSFRVRHLPVAKPRRRVSRTWVVVATTGIWLARDHFIRVPPMLILPRGSRPWVVFAATSWAGHPFIEPRILTDFVWIKRCKFAANEHVAFFWNGLC